MAGPLGLVIPFDEYDELFRSTSAGLDGYDDLGPSLIKLSEREVLPLAGLEIPDPFGALFSVEFIPRFSTEDCSREVVGVPFGVTMELGDAVSALAFLEPDRGVILGLIMFLIGVAKFSLLTLFSPAE